MSQPRDPWSTPDDVQWQNPAGPYPAPPQPGGHYQVNQVGQASFAMTPLRPVAPQELAPDRPPTVTAATWIWIAGAVLSVALLPVLFLTNSEYLIGQEDVVSQRRQAAGEFGVRALAMMSGFGMLIAAAPYIAFAIVLRNGQSWARILLTILAVLGALSMFVILSFALAAQVWQPAVAMGVVVIGLTVAAVVLQFLPPSNRFVH
ncbi:hypothetical protein SAMN05216553_102402 [Lentzea fradiae]|uniref:Uncharacterized protein n=1 Tax=Lentzea fradiae TaxID=200378 RepID=A0A1G7MMA0_9PSEU|nr:hypothetical protein [Lentzea fradiae]SDF62847.1 hypothetical protein SAMN05216553_102402 [Lentzea fradiae]